MSTLYPFSAIVGQEELKLALLLNAVSPQVGGVLVRGEKGTAKSTAVRALAGLLPPVRVVAGCPYSCDPETPNPECPAGPHKEDAPDAPAIERPVRLVELPVGASTDRLTGTLDIEQALTEGVRSFEPGILAAAHRGILYVDEVNLLPDHLVDLLLDVAAMGVNRVEREGVSISHPARFLLVGTMNPEEGELRPQLLDRFGLSVEVAGGMEVEDRTEVVRRRLHYEADPQEFATKWSPADRAVADRIGAARGRLPGVFLGEARLREASGVCAELAVDGLRGDLVTAKAARTLAAWEGRETVERGDVERAALLALAHRRRRGPFDEPGLTPQEIQDSLPDDDPPDTDLPDTDPPQPPPGDRPPRSDDPSGEGESPEGASGGADEGEPSGEPGSSGGSEDPQSAGSGEKTHAPDGSFEAGSRIEVPEPGENGPSGRRSRSVGERGHPVGDRPARSGEVDLALAATLRTAAVKQRSRRRTLQRSRQPPGLILRREDLRANIREGREGNLILFCVDASGSMAARDRMSAVKGAALELLSDAYRKRDRVALVSFRGEVAHTLLPPTSSVDLAAARLTGLTTGGRTPLAAGLEEAGRVILRERNRDRQRRPLLVVLTDGRTTSGPEPRAVAGRLRQTGLASVVVDTESGYARLGLAAELAVALGGRCVRLDELSSRSLLETVAATSSGGRPVGDGSQRRRRVA